MELKITKEKILEAAEKCSTAKQTLKILFPEAFNEDVVMSFQKGDILLSKNNRSKQYLIAIDNEKKLRIVGLHSSYIWQDMKIKAVEHFVTAHDLKSVFGGRDISQYNVKRGGKIYNTCTAKEIDYNNA